MTQYLVAIGASQDIGDMDPVAPQPSTIGVQYARTVWAADGTRYATGPYVEFMFDLVQGTTAYQALLTQFGVNASLKAAVSIYARDETYTWRYYNGVAYQPVVGDDVTWTRYFPRRIKILIRDLATYTPADA